MKLDKNLFIKIDYVLFIQTRLVPIIHKVGIVCTGHWKVDSEYAITGNEEFHAGLWYRKLCVKKGIMDDMKRQYEENLW
ncbi:hypothetical protein THMA_1557 [Thermotoga maritima MSB8]|nr:hypothetical protein THEMA_06675 [Thermotoga maritima MSB8]AKE27412.1 hypothetical protein THMC_1557 [Thermotoga maritima]AKE29284.1 hypothetical protein THMA_1557 [Thermotoga maritima MSB8]AKE31156.1 hypothetical protein THMB_1557 [Thermotoga maritima]